jgi:hypothetical protein
MGVRCLALALRRKLLYVWHPSQCVAQQLVAVHPSEDLHMMPAILQTLQGDTSYGALIEGDLNPAAAGPAPAAAGARAAVEGPPEAAAQAEGTAECPEGVGLAAATRPPGAAAPASSAVQGSFMLLPAQQQVQAQQLQAAAVPAGFPANFTGNFNVDDDDDEEFQLDPLDWLLDDEADAAEEEALMKLVEPSIEALSDFQQPEGPATAAAAPSRRRTQREAARRAAERIAATQQQQWMQEHPHMQQHQQGLYMQPEPGTTGLGGTGDGLMQQQQQQQVLQPLIPATAAGEVLVQQQQQQLDFPGGPGQQQAGGMPQPSLWGTAGGQQQQELHGLHSAMLQQQQHMQSRANAWDARAVQSGCRQQQQQQQQQQHSRAASSVLTIRAQQLQQLYHQVALHTQLLTQLYVMTAVDPSPAAQAMASSAGQMLEQIKRLHAVSTGSLRGQQLGQLVQHAFRDAGHNSSAAAAVLPGRPRARGTPAAAWVPQFNNMQ